MDCNGKERVVAGGDKVEILVFAVEGERGEREALHLGHSG